MPKIQLFFEITDFSTDKNGNPEPIGIMVEMGEANSVPDYEALVKSVDTQELLDRIGLGHSVGPKRVRIITPEEYAEKYETEEESD